MNTVYDITTQSYNLVSDISSGQAKGHFSIAALISSIEEVNNKMRNADNAFSVEQSVNEFNSANKILDEKADSAKKHKKKTIITGIASGIGMGVTSFATLGTSSFEHGFKHFSKEKAKDSKLPFSFVSDSRKDYRTQLEKHYQVSNAIHKVKYEGRTGDLAELTSELNDIEEKFKSRAGYDLLHGTKHAGLHAASQHVDLMSGGINAMGEFAGMNAAAGASSDERQAELDGTFEHFFQKDSDSYSQKARSVSQQTMQTVESLVGIIGKLQDAMTLK